MSKNRQIRPEQMKKCNEPAFGGGGAACKRLRTPAIDNMHVSPLLFHSQSYIRALKECC